MAGEEYDTSHLLVGIDGVPLGGPTDAELERIAAGHRRRDLLAALERWRGGDVTAFIEMIRLVWKNDPERVPFEVVEAAGELVERATAEDERRHRREWLAHTERWETFVELRSRGRELLARFGDRRGLTVESAREAVAESLKSTARTVRASFELIQEAGGPDATFESYLEVRRRRKARRKR